MPTKKFFRTARIVSLGRNTYWLWNTAILLIGVFSIMATAFPTQAGAFWPFSTANANTGATSATFAYASTEGALLRAPSTPDPAAAAQNNITIAMTGGSALIAADSPGGVVTKNPTTFSNGQISLYVVRAGDSLSGIAQMFGVSVNTILWSNNITNPSLIKPGNTLLILPVSGVQHTVTKGETLASIAKKYHANAHGIALYNGLSAGASLVVGTALVIPNGEKSTPHRTHRTRRARVRGRGGHRGRVIPPNPYRGGSGPALPGFFSDPLPGGIITQRLHGWNAFDIGAPRGTRIYAAAAGTVIVANFGGWGGGYGKHVVIDHGNGTQTLYAHMSRDISHVGEHVSRGQIIGYVGMTGEATGPHLHFEVRGAENPFTPCALHEVDTSCFMK